jgi:MSHA biogenesis protein MshL
MLQATMIQTGPVHRMRVTLVFRALALFALGTCANAAAQSGASGPPSAEGSGLDPMAVSQLEASRTGAPAQSVPRSLQPPKAAPGQSLQPLAVSQLDDRRHDSALDGRTFSLSLSEPVSINDLLLLLVRDTDLSVAPAPDIQGTFIGDLKNVTVRQALELVLPPLGLDYSTQGSFVRVFKRRAEMRMFEVDHLASRHAADRPLPASSAMSVDRSGRAAAEDSAGFFEELAAGVRALLSPDGIFSLDRQAGLLQVTDYADRLDRIELYVEAAQTRALRQVQIQAEVIEVDLDERHARGVDWAEVLASAGKSVSLSQPLARSGGSAVTLAANIRDTRGLLDALATQGKVNVLASPRLVAMNNEPAFMRVGTQDVFFVRTSLVDASTGRPVQATVTPQPMTEGILLCVTPQIAGDGTVQMSISPSVSERTGQATSRLGDTVPIISIREADTLVRMREDETFVMSGLTQTRTTRGTGEPGLKGLFRHDESTPRKVDLVILLRATIVAPGAVLEVAAGEGTRSDRAQSPARK